MSLWHGPQNAVAFYNEISVEAFPSFENEFFGTVHTDQFGKSPLLTFLLLWKNKPHSVKNTLACFCAIVGDEIKSTQIIGY